MMRRLGPLALLALQGLGCGEARLLDSTTEGQTRLRLAPSEFEGSVTCRKGTPGALQTYMVRLQEVTGDAETDAGLATAFTSGAVPCDQAVLFPTVAGHYYAAEIRGFDRVVSDTEAAALPGRWTATCGHAGTSDADGGLQPFRSTLSLRGITVPMRGCSSFSNGSAGSAVSQLVIDQSSALGPLRCGQAAGAVASLRASLNGVTHTARCGDPLVFSVTGAERFHTIALTAFGLDADSGAPSAPVPTAALPDAGADAGEPLDASAGPPAAAELADAGSSGDGPVIGVPRWATQCVGRSLPGVAAPAYCDPLQPLP